MMKHTRRSAVTALLGAILLLVTAAGASGAARDVTVNLTSGVGEFRLRVID